MRREVSGGAHLRHRNHDSAAEVLENGFVKMRLVENLDWCTQIFKPSPVQSKGLVLRTRTSFF